ncbi:MAG: hypothetical protein ACT4NT_01270 [Nitrososphaerota archaeon]
MNKKLNAIVFGLIGMLIIQVSPAFADPSTLAYYGKGVVTESSPFVDEVIRTIINNDKAAVVHPGQNGIEIVRMDIQPSESCVQTQLTFCFVGTVTLTKNTNIHEIGDEVELTLDLQNKKQIMTVMSGQMQGTTITIDLSKTIVKSDDPFTISIMQEGGFAGLPGKTMTFDSSTGETTLVDSMRELTTPLSQDDIEKITKMVRINNLLNIEQTDYPPHPSSADYFTYSLEFSQGIFQKTITWTDTSENVPSKLSALKQTIQSIVENDESSDQDAEIAEIAKNFVMSAPTFAFDGMEDTLTIGSISVLESFPVQYQLEVLFTSTHGGFGNRTGQMITQVLTPHIVDVLISEGNVLSAVIDDTWDEMNHQFVLKAP